MFLRGLRRKKCDHFDTLTDGKYESTTFFKNQFFAFRNACYSHDGTEKTSFVLLHLRLSSLEF